MSFNILFDEYEKAIAINRKVVGSFRSTIDNFIEDDGEKLNLLKNLKTHLETAVLDESLLEGGREIYENCEEKIQNPDNEEQEIDFVAEAEKEYKELIVASKKKEHIKLILENDATMQQLVKNIESLQDSSDSEDNGDLGDEEIVATQQDINLVDPISKTLMTRPVRHIVCGHVYDKPSLIQMMKQSRRKGFSCPVVGCSYRKPIEEMNLEDAHDYIREIQKRKRDGTYNL